MNMIRASGLWPAAIALVLSIVGAMFLILTGLGELNPIFFFIEFSIAALLLPLGRIALRPVGDSRIQFVRSVNATYIIWAMINVTVNLPETWLGDRAVLIKYGAIALECVFILFFLLAAKRSYRR